MLNNYMEAFPKIDLFPRLTKVAEFVASLVRHLPDDGYLSDHNSGGGPMLDRELYDIPNHADNGDSLKDL